MVAQVAGAAQVGTAVMAGKVAARRPKVDTADRVLKAAKAEMVGFNMAARGNNNRSGRNNHSGNSNRHNSHSRNSLSNPPLRVASQVKKIDPNPPVGHVYSKTTDQIPSSRRL